MSMNRRQFARVGDILPAVLRSVGLDKKLKEREILLAWPAAVGPDIAARAQAVSIDKGVLLVNVEHSAWMQELHFMEAEIIRKLRDMVPNVELRKIRFGTHR